MWYGAACGAMEGVGEMLVARARARLGIHLNIFILIIPIQAQACSVLRSCVSTSICCVMRDMAIWRPNLPASNVFVNRRV